MIKPIIVISSILAVAALFGFTYRSGATKARDVERKACAYAELKLFAEIDAERKGFVESQENLRAKLQAEIDAVSENSRLRILDLHNARLAQEKRLTNAITQAANSSVCYIDPIDDGLREYYEARVASEVRPDKDKTGRDSKGFTDPS